MPNIQRRMSYFVLVYDRPRESLLELREFGQDELLAAEQYRLERQRDALAGHLDRDVILLQAASRAVLEQTHGSYFLSREDLLKRVRDAAGTP